MVRTALALLMLLASFIAAIAVVAVGGMGYAALLVSFALLIAGFLGLRVARGSPAGAAPLQITICVSCLIAIAMLAGLSWPPVGAEFTVWIATLCAITLSVVALATNARHPRLTFALLGFPAIDSLWMIIRLMRIFHAFGAESIGPSVILAYFVSAAMAAGWIVAPWHAVKADSARRHLDTAS